MHTYFLLFTEKLRRYLIDFMLYNSIQQLYETSLSIHERIIASTNVSTVITNLRYS